MTHSPFGRPKSKASSTLIGRWAARRRDAWPDPDDYETPPERWPLPLTTTPDRRPLFQRVIAALPIVLIAFLLGLSFFLFVTG